LILENLSDLLGNDLCIGCGACGALEGGPNIRFNDRKGLYEPENASFASQDTAKVCPFLGDNPLLDAVERDHHDSLIGGYHSVFAGYFLDPAERAQSTSGGLVNYFIKRLFETDEIDTVIHLKNSPSNEESIFHYGLSGSYAEASEARGTKYYPGEISSAVKIARDVEGRYAFIGLPCYVRAMRLIMKHDEVLRSRFRVLISLVCGHQKTKNYSNYLASLAGVKSLEDITNIDYRVPVSGNNAHLYKAKVFDKAGDVYYSRPMKEIYAEDWSMGLCMPKVCQYCDDVAGEHADITFGDAWIEPYSLDGKGTNIVIARDERWRNLLNTSEVVIDELTPQDFANSQAGSFRFRREGAFLRKTESMDMISPQIRVAKLNEGGLAMLDEVKKRHDLSAVLRYRERMYLGERLPSHLGYLSFYITTLFHTKAFEIYKRGILRAIIPSGFKRFAKRFLGLSSVNPKRTPYKSSHHLQDK
jgi:coenzyme F420 hydrogenase subunit beta